MKGILSVILVSLVMISTAFAGEKLTLTKVKTLGVMKNEVIFQSKNVKKVKGTNVVKGKLVVQWGLHVYEVVTGFYTCNTKNICRLTDYERVATFEKCVVKNQSVKCTKKIAGDEASSTRDSDIVISPDGLLESETNSRESIDELSDDFGSSINEEATII